MKAFQSKMIKMIDYTLEDTADEDKGFPYTLLNIFEWEEARWLQRRLEIQHFRYKSSWNQKGN